ncbi:hypothetical protein Pelo_11453 [Pelomyxa schiedti]|nr:hypothetical protein Pelo_11453 [Pelomyxa schiedti]
MYCGNFALWAIGFTLFCFCVFPGAIMMAVGGAGYSDTSKRCKTHCWVVWANVTVDGGSYQCCTQPSYRQCYNWADCCDYTCHCTLYAESCSGVFVPSLRDVDHTTTQYSDCAVPDSQCIEDEYSCITTPSAVKFDNGTQTWECWINPDPNLDGTTYTTFDSDYSQTELVNICVGAGLFGVSLVGLAILGLAFALYKMNINIGHDVQFNWGN